MNDVIICQDMTKTMRKCIEYEHFICWGKKKEKKPTHVQLLFCNSEQKDTVYPAYINIPYRLN